MEASQCNFVKTGTGVRTCDGWPNGFANRLASSRKSQKVIISRIYSFVSTSVGWPNGEKLASTCAELRTNSKLIRILSER